MWKAMEAKARKVRMAEAEGRGEKRRRSKEKG